MILVTAILVLAAQQEPPTEGQTKNIRERAVAAFDVNGDGRLDVEEREALRKSGKQFTPQKERFRRGGRRTKFDAATVRKFDRNKDGKLDEDESKVVWRAIFARWGELVGEYKAFRNDKPIVPNLQKMMADAKSGNIKDFPPQLYSFIQGSIDRAGRSGRGPSRHPLAKFDTNGDGRLSATELKNARNAIAAIGKAAK